MATALGERIIETLKKRNMTQKDLAKRLGISESVISRYISGSREPKPEMIANIATALHTTSDYLLGIEKGEFNHANIKRLIARNVKNMSEEQKRELIKALFGEE